jgi:hypothetical protein
LDQETISELVKFHSEIGNMVRSSMMKLNNKELVEQIEKSGQRFTIHPFKWRSCGVVLLVL